MTITEQEITAGFEKLLDAGDEEGALELAKSIRDLSVAVAFSDFAEKLSEGELKTEVTKLRRQWRSAIDDGRLTHAQVAQQMAKLMNVEYTP